MAAVLFFRRPLDADNGDSVNLQRACGSPGAAPSIAKDPAVHIVSPHTGTVHTERDKAHRHQL
jgi:hypothetical protein